MKCICNYNKLIKEVEVFKQRLKILLEYEEKIKEEKQLINDLIKKNQIAIKKIESTLKELEDIENNLYYEIVVNGIGVTKTVEAIAEKYNVDVSTIWKNYYPQVKEKIQEISYIKEEENSEENRDN